MVAPLSAFMHRAYVAPIDCFLSMATVSTGHGKINMVNYCAGDFCSFFIFEHKSYCVLLHCICLKERLNVTENVFLTV